MMCTWLTKAEFKVYEKVEDEYLNGLLQEVRTLSNNKNFLQERAVVKKGFLRKTISNKLYTLYISLGEGEVQVINFCQDHDWSINSTVTKSYIVTFLLGILSGADMQKNKYNSQ